MYVAVLTAGADADTDMMPVVEAIVIPVGRFATAKTGELLTLTQPDGVMVVAVPDRMVNGEEE